MTFIEINNDGVEYIYLTKDFNPADKKKAEIIKIVYPNGKIIFGEAAPKDF